MDVFFSLSTCYRLKEATETHKKVEHEIKIAVFTLINEINKKGKSLLQQLEVWGSAVAEINLSAGTDLSPVDFLSNSSNNS